MSRSVNSLCPDCFSCLCYFYLLLFLCIYIGPPAAADIVGLSAETKDTKVTIKWNVPENNGAPITQYNVYQRSMNDDGPLRDWKEIGGRKNPLIREVSVTLEKGMEYEFVVTATNKFGESLKEEEKIKKIVVSGGKYVAKIAQMQWKVKPGTGRAAGATL